MKQLASIADLQPIATDMGLSLGPMDVHIWCYMAGPDQSMDHAKVLEMLSPEEQDRYAQFSHDNRQKQYLATRTLCRWVLSRYAPVRPADWRFQLDGRGKPAIGAPILPSPLWFSLSNTAETSVCAVSRASCHIGVDIERIDQDIDCLEIAAQFFPDMETNALRRIAPAQRGEAFVRHWGLKESFVKAFGISLDQGLAGTAFQFAECGDIGVSFAAPLNESPVNWRFNLLRLNTEQILALSVRTDTAGPLHLYAAKCIPMRGIVDSMAPECSEKLARAV